MVELEKEDSSLAGMGVFPNDVKVGDVGVPPNEVLGGNELFDDVLNVPNVSDCRDLESNDDVSLRCCCCCTKLLFKESVVLSNCVDGEEELSADDDLDGGKELDCSGLDSAALPRPCCCPNVSLAGMDMELLLNGVDGGLELCLDVSKELPSD